MDGHFLDLISQPESGIELAHQQKKFLIQQEQGQVSQGVTIALPDDVMLEIFHQFSKGYPNEFLFEWHKLVCVCRRWRSIILAYPVRLNLRLYCTWRCGNSMRKLLDIWPYPLAVVYEITPNERKQIIDDNIIAALEHRDRVQSIDIQVKHSVKSLYRKIATVMQGPFPVLKSLKFYGTLTLPDTFLIGSAPCLQHLSLSLSSFPSFPRLLSSSTDLTTLHLLDIPTSWYIPPETMATSLSSLPKLESLNMQFESQTLYPQREYRPVPPASRFVLPSLTKLDFRGISEYLEVLTARFDAPLLDEFDIHFIDLSVFELDIPEIIRFFGRLLEPLWVDRDRDNLYLMMYPSQRVSIHYPLDPKSFYYSQGRSWHWHFDCEELDWPDIFTSMAQICNHMLSLSFRSSVESLSIRFDDLFSLSEIQPYNRYEIDPTQWLQLFHSFSSVRRLSISATLELSIAATLKGLTGESAAHVFPSLHSLTILGDSYMPRETIPQGIQSFISARQRLGRPVALLRL